MFKYKISLYKRGEWLLQCDGAAYLSVRDLLFSKAILNEKYVIPMTWPSKWPEQVVKEFSEGRRLKHTYGWGIHMPRQDWREFFLIFKSHVGIGRSKNRTWTKCSRAGRFCRITFHEITGGFIDWIIHVRFTAVVRLDRQYSRMKYYAILCFEIDAATLFSTQAVKVQKSYIRTDNYFYLLLRSWWNSRLA